MIRSKSGGGAFSYYEPTVWNKLPDDLRCTRIVASFKSKLKTYMYSQAYGQPVPPSLCLSLSLSLWVCVGGHIYLNMHSCPILFCSYWVPVKHIELTLCEMRYINKSDVTWLVMPSTSSVCMTCAVCGTGINWHASMHLLCGAAQWHHSTGWTGVTLAVTGNTEYSRKQVCWLSILSLPEHFAMSGNKLSWSITNMQGHMPDESCKCQEEQEKTHITVTTFWRFTVLPWRYINCHCLGVWLNLKTGLHGSYFIFYLYPVAIRPHQYHPLGCCAVMLLSVRLCPHGVKSNTVLHTVCVHRLENLLSSLLHSCILYNNVTSRVFIPFGLKFCCRLLRVHIWFSFCCGAFIMLWVSPALPDLIVSWQKTTFWTTDMSRIKLLMKIRGYCSFFGVWVHEIMASVWLGVCCYFLFFIQKFHILSI